MDELRIRVERVVARKSRGAKGPPILPEVPLPSLCSGKYSVKAFSEPPVSPGYKLRSPIESGPHICEYLADYCGAYIDAYASAAVAFEQAGMGSYKKAKSMLVNRFVNAYIRQGLVSCHGNVTKAAVKAGKNRRAYSALMKLHGIDAFPYRGDLHDTDADG
jgi:DNA-binding NtrC family response regulator